MRCPRFTSWVGFLATFLLLFASIPSLNAQNVRLETRLNRSSVVIGDQVVLTFRINQPAAAKVWFPQFPDTIVNLVEIVDRKPADTVKNNQGQLEVSQDLVLASFDSGSYVIGPFWFKYEADGRTDSLMSSPVNLYVNTLAVDTTKSFVDIRPVIETPLTFREMLPYILGGILLIAGALAGYWYYRKRKKRKPAFGFLQKPREPAHVIALRDLDELKEKKLWQQDRLKEYHSELSDVVRRYIEHRFQVHAMEQTTDEIFAALAGTRLIDSINEEKLRQILSLADFVKFARFRPLPDENDLSLRNAYAFVIQTKESVNLLETGAERSTQPKPE